MQKLMDWIGKNNTFVIVLIIAVFAVITLSLLIVVMTSNSSTKRNLKALVKAMQYEHRPMVIPRFANLDGKVKCLVFENIGNQYAKNISVLINKEWLEAKEKLPDFKNNNIVLRKFANKKFTLSPSEKLTYSLYIIGASSVESFKNQMLKTIIRYTDTSEKLRYEESFVLDLSLSEDSLAEASDFSRGIHKLAEKLQRQEQAFRNIDYRIFEMSKRMLKINNITELSEMNDKSLNENERIERLEKLEKLEKIEKILKEDDEEK